MGYTQNCEIWRRASLGTLIISQEKPIWRTMWGPCFGHKRAVFWPFLGKGDYGIHPELWNLAWSLPGHIDYDSGRIKWKEQVRTIFCHERAIFWPFIGKGDNGIHPELWNLAWSIPGYIVYDSGGKKFEGPHEDHVLAIKGHILAISRIGGYMINPAM